MCFLVARRSSVAAPFNVAWHLQALGDEPLFVSRVGNDAAGRDIRQAMQDWQMNLSGLQDDSQHPSGRVEVHFEGGEPAYQIVADCAYDFIDGSALPPADLGVLYHGTLALRNEVSQRALQRLKQQHDAAVFVDVNLRAPWWRKEQVQIVLGEARWVKLNEEELQLLGDSTANWRSCRAGICPELWSGAAYCHLWQCRCFCL